MVFFAFLYYKKKVPGVELAGYGWILLDVALRCSSPVYATLWLWRI
ncbi:MAG: hypothetical protein J0I90_08175 [Nitrosospira sp.]|nr:hypothetical protein [Nitrosospira sp.]